MEQPSQCHAGLKPDVREDTRRSSGCGGKGEGRPADDSIKPSLPCLRYLLYGGELRYLNDTGTCEVRTTHPYVRDYYDTHTDRSTTMYRRLTTARARAWRRLIRRPLGALVKPGLSPSSDIIMTQALCQTRKKRQIFPRQTQNASNPARDVIPHPNLPVSRIASTQFREPCSNAAGGTWDTCCALRCPASSHLIPTSSSRFIHDQSVSFMSKDKHNQAILCAEVLSSSTPHSSRGRNHSSSQVYAWGAVGATIVRGAVDLSWMRTTGHNRDQKV